jgi:hypothetical protein
MASLRKFNRMVKSPFTTIKIIRKRRGPYNRYGNRYKSRYSRFSRFSRWPRRRLNTGKFYGA